LLISLVIAGIRNVFHYIVNVIIVEQNIFQVWNCRTYLAQYILFSFFNHCRSMVYFKEKI